MNPPSPGQTPFPILMYHALWPADLSAAGRDALWAADPQMRDPGARLYALDHRDFERQLEAIADTGRLTPESWDALDSPEAHSLWITFDDGHRSNATLALPTLARLGLTAMFFITTDWICTDGFMNEDELRALRAAGMLIGTHGCSHRYFSDLPEADLRRELTDSKRRLESILNEEIPALALPGGRNHAAIRRLAAEAGYRHVFTSRMELARPGGDPLDWPRIAVTQRLPADFVARLAGGDHAPLARLARAQRRRDLAKRLLGNALYDRLRGAVLGRG